MFGISWVKNALQQREIDNQRWERGFDGVNQSPMKSVEANIKRGEKSMHKAIIEKTGVHRAMYLNGNAEFEGGWVDFEWGDEGRIRPNGKTKGGMGISHIIEGRMRKDGLTQEQAIKFLTKNVPETIAKGTIKDVEFDPKNQNIVAVIVVYGITKIVFKRTKGSNAWIISAYDMNRTKGVVQVQKS